MEIEINNLSFSYKDINVIDNLSLRINEHEFVSLLGPNGSGKSTLIKCICKILKIKHGEIIIDGNNINSYSGKDLAKIIGYVPQNTNNQNPATVYEILELGRCPYINWKLNKSDRIIIDDVIEQFCLGDFLKKQFNQLSGGQQQKIKIARAIVQEPKILLLDEPINNLDIRHQIEVLSLLSDIVKEKHITTLMAIHDLAFAAKFSKTIIMMNDGRIVDNGTPEKVINSDNVKDVYGIDVEIVKHKESILLAL